MAMTMTAGEVAGKAIDESVSTGFMRGCDA
jgi:hypothetical protein